MKITICILIIFLLTSCNKKEIEINSLGQLLDKHFDAVGIHNLDNCKSLLIREMMADYEDSFAYNIIEIKMKKPDKYSYISSINNYMPIFPNNYGDIWTLKYKHYNENTADTLKALKKFYLYGCISLFLDKQAGNKLEYLGKIKYGERFYYKVKADKSFIAYNLLFVNGSSYIFEIDAENFLITKVVNGDLTFYFNDYKEVDGIKYPSKVEIDNFGIKFLLKQVFYYKPNIEIPDSEFTGPNKSYTKK